MKVSENTLDVGSLEIRGATVAKRKGKASPKEKLLH